MEEQIAKDRRKVGEYQLQEWFLSNNESVMVEFRARNE